jgi:hypothetical protein
MSPSPPGATNGTAKNVPKETENHGAKKRTENEKPDPVPIEL